jgi:epoxyqueuosine reductase
MQAELIERLESEGYRARAVSSQHVDELKDNIEMRLKEGSLKEAVYDMYKRVLIPSPPEDLPAHQSLVVIAVPQPQIRFTFALNGERVPAIVPPTYLHGRATEDKIKTIVDSVLEPAGYGAVTAFLPRKLLAVRGGLAEYGKNNITYVGGMGSFHRISAFYSDMPCEEETWREPAMMPRCETCTICADECPSDAIDPGRFLIRAEMCITFHNEHPNEVPFPEWLDPTWHNCLVGCLICQRACPEDSEVIDWTEDGMEFTEEETRFLLDFEPAGKELWTPEGPQAPEGLPASLAAKLEESDLAGLLEVIPRNLKALLEATARTIL